MIQPCQRLKLLLSTVTLGLLAACGGGGGSSGGSAVIAATPAASAPSSTPSAPPAPPAPPATLSGVAAFGAPLTGARVQVVDASGAVVGSGTTHPADGSFTLTLSTASPTAPLLLQASGVDAADNPLILHSALATVAASNTVNITPLTDAIVALTLGTDPKAVFAGAKEQSKLLAGLATLTPASDFVKTLVKTNLADAKAGDTTKLNLLGDGSFRADKTGVDLALETLRVGVGAGAQGNAQLQLSNKFASSATPEVLVDLATARAELAKTSGALPANAITSTLKATTSPTTVVANFGALDELGTAINKAIAEGGGTALAALTAKYTQDNGRDAAALTALLASYASRNMQLGRIQVTGCADDNPAKNSCSKLRVAARASDISGAQIDGFSDTLSYAAGTTPKWSLVGNGQAADVGVYALAWLALAADGSVLSASPSNPALGVQLLVQGKLAGATVQTPGGYSLPLVPCGAGQMCSTSVTGATSAVATGELADSSVLQSVSTWLGTADLAPGARYKVSYTTLAGAAGSRYATLRAAAGSTPASDRFPIIDGVKPSLPLSGSALLNGTTLGWATWAAAHPEMRVFVLRTVLRSDTDPALIIDQAPTSWSATSATLPAPTVDPAFAISGIKLWLGAIDSAGRRYYTSYTLLP